MPLPSDHQDLRNVSSRRGPVQARTMTAPLEFHAQIRLLGGLAIALIDDPKCSRAGAAAWMWGRPPRLWQKRCVLATSLKRENNAKEK